MIFNVSSYLINPLKTFEANFFKKPIFNLDVSEKAGYLALGGGKLRTNV